MVVQHVGVVVADGEGAAFEAALVEVRQRLFMLAGFRGFTVLQGEEHPTRYLVDVRWETLDELVDVVGSGRFDRAWAPARPFCDGPLEVSHYAERPGLSSRGPGVITDLSWLSD